MKNGNHQEPSVKLKGPRKTMKKGPKYGKDNKKTPF
jgi:hypothetical protein